MDEGKKTAILPSMGEARAKGVSRSRACAMWMINRKRVVRWAMIWKRGQSLDNGKPGPKDPVHRLLSEERIAVAAMAVEERYADLSHRILAVRAWDLQLFFVSFSSVYRILCSEGLMSMREAHRHYNGRSVPPARKEITGPNQRWCWDISYLRTYERSVFLYLYLLLDEYSPQGDPLADQLAPEGRGCQTVTRSWAALRKHPGLS